MNDIYELAKQYANCISQKQQQEGFKLTLHHYRNARGELLYVKMRLKNAETGKKQILPIQFIGTPDQTTPLSWQIGEPDFSRIYPEGNGKKPLYLLDNLVANQDTVYIVEGEQKADLALMLGLMATTSGGSNTVKSYDWQPLAGRKCRIWRDNDDAGSKWLGEVLAVLASVPSGDVEVIDVAQLGLAAKEDIVDYVKRLRIHNSTIRKDEIAEKIENLPILSDEQVLALLPQPTSPILTQNNKVTQNHQSQAAIVYENGYIELLSDGLYFIKYDDEGEIKTKSFICSPLTILARTRDANSQNWGIWCQWHDLEGIKHDLTLPISLLQGDSREYRQQLANHGLVIATSAKGRACLDAYLNFYPTDNIALCVDTVGWHGQQYVLPNRVFGQGETIVYQSPSPHKPPYQQQGTLKDWQANISQKIAQQSNIVFALCVAFSGQLLPLVNESGGGFHFVGRSSKGKSLTAKLACSVWGYPKHYMHTWRATSNAQENVAAQHNHGFIALDEINLANPNTIGDVVYMLADGEGKDRMSKAGHNRPTLRWQVVYLSTGEETLEAIQNRAGKPNKAGQEVRFVSLEAVTDDALGIFDSLSDGYATPAAQADALSQASHAYFGTAGVAWLEHITQDKATTSQAAIQRIDDFVQAYPSLSSQAGRVCRLFAVVASAGELATQAGITGWQVGVATACVKQCFARWLANFAHDGDYEEYQVLSNVRAFIEQYGESRFSNWGSDGFYQKVNNRVGYIRQGDYLFFKQGFAEACQPFTIKTATKVLMKYKLMRINETDRDTYKVNEKGGKKNARYYYVSADILSMDFDSGISGKTGSDVTTAGVAALGDTMLKRDGLGYVAASAEDLGDSVPTHPKTQATIRDCASVEPTADYPTSQNSHAQSTFAANSKSDWVFDD